MVRLRTWPYGTRRKVTVVKVAATSSGQVVMCSDDLMKGEGYILIQEPDQSVAAGQQRTIEFLRGGPTGGYWAFTSE